MAYGYIKKHQKVLKNGKMTNRFLAKISYRSYIDDERLAEEISKMSTASPADVMLVLTALEDRISLHVSTGNVVKLKNIGSFYPTIHAHAVDDPDKVNQFTISNKGVRFEPSQHFRKRIKETGVELVDKRVFEADTHPRKKKDEEQ